MLLYLILFIIPVIAYTNNGIENRNNKFLIWYTGLLALFVGLSDMLGGYDRYIYGAVFDDLANHIGYDSVEIKDFFQFETGFSVLTYLIALITENRYIYIFILTLIIYYNIYLSFKRHIINYPLAFIIFLGLFFFFTFTYLRQVLSVTISWLAIKYILDKNWKVSILYLAVIALMHKSGLVFSLLVFIPTKKWSQKQVITTLIVCLIIGLSGVTSSLYDRFVAITDVASVNNYSDVQGARLAYILEVIFFVWAILSNYSKIEDNKYNNLFLNMCWCFCAMLLLFLRSENGGRMSWYFIFGIIYVLTYIATKSSSSIISNAKSNFSKLILVVMLLLYVRIYYSWQPYELLYPYKTFLTDGHRDLDPIWAKYEYDHNYDADKFYRPIFRFY